MLSATTDGHASSCYSTGPDGVPVYADCPPSFRRLRVPFPPDALTLTAGKYHLVVTWTRPLTAWGPIIDYDVEYRIKGSVGWSSHSFSGTGRSTTISTLSSNTTYEVRVRAENGYGKGWWSGSTTATTERDPPGKPDPPGVTAGKHSLAVTWTKPSNTGPAISDYDVQYRKAGRVVWSSHSFSGTGTTTTIRGLSSNTKYEVQVRAENADGESPWSDSGTADTKRAPPGKPDVPTLAAGKHELAVTWRAPSNTGPAISDYDVEYRIEGSVGWSPHLFSGTGRSTTITGLSSNTTYEVKVRAENADGESPWSEPGTGDTKPAPPGKPAAPTLTAGTHSLAVTWTEPLNTGPAISDYDVEYRIEGSVGWSSHSFSGTGRSTTITGLSSNTTYEVKVRAENADGESPWSEPGTGDTKPDPPGKPAAPTLTAGKHSLAVTWTKPSNTGPAISDYDVEYRIEGSVGWSPHSFSGTGRSTTITGLSSNTTYEVKVRAENADGESPWSEPGTATTERDPPGKLALPGVTAGKHSLAVTWTKPSNTGPAISDYDVEYRIEGSVGWSPHSFSGTGRSTTITGLSSNTRYEVRVRAGNVDGEGEWSNPGTATTERDPPGKCALPGVTAGKHSLTVTWTKPSNTGPPISDYDVEYRIKGSVGWSLHSFSGTGRSTTITGLSSNTRYEVRVRAGNVDGEGEWSDSTTERTERDPPEKPDAPTVRAAGTSALTVTWSVPSNTGPPISHYYVQFREFNERTVAYQRAVGTDATITGLLPGRSYEVQVRATNADGTGAWSESGVGQTETLTVGFGASTYTATEGGSEAAVTVNLSAAAVEELTIPITVSAGAATEPGDYTVSGLSSGAVTFAVGASSRTLTVTATEDTDSADESVELGFGDLPSGVSAGTTVTVAVALTDDDPLTVTLSGPVGPVGGAFDVTVTFSEEVTGFEAGDLTVVGGTVTVTGSGAEYAAAVTPSGSGTVTMDVAAGVVQDPAGNGNEAAAQFSVAVQHACSSGVAVPTPSGNPGLVRDCGTLLAAKDELAGTATLNWSADVAMSSWDGVRIAGTPSRVTRLELRNRQLSGIIPTALGSLPKLKRLDLGRNRLNGAIPSDLGDLRNLARLYLHSNELSGSIPSELGDLSALKRLWLSANDLSGLVPGELGSLAGLVELYLQSNRLSGCVPSSLGSIASDKRDFGELRLCTDGPPRPLAPAVAATGPSSVSVTWTEPVVAGLAIDSYDVRHREVGDQAFNPPVTGATDTTTTITGLLPGRTYEVQVRAHSGGRAGPWSPSGIGTTATLTVTFGPGPFTAIEGGSAETIVVALSTAPTEATAIPITATGVDTAESADYAVSGLSGGALTFAVNEQTRSITVAASQDHDSADEAVLLGFGTLPRSVSEGTLTTARVTLKDNDAAPLAVGFGASAYTAVEGGRAVTIPVRLNQPALHELRIAITATARGTTAAGDFSIGGLTAGALTFVVGDDTKHITVAAVPDADAADEAVVIGFGAGVPTRSAATAEVTLDDDDAAPLTAAFGAAGYTAAEGGAGVSVAVELSQPALSALSVPITVHAHGTTVPGDYVVAGLSAGAALFAPGERRRTFTVTAVDDADDADETVVLGFGAGLPAGSPARSAITLQDDDGTGVSYGAGRYRVAEGGSLTVRVTLLPAPASAVTIPITVAAQGTTVSGDYVVHGLTPANGLTFAAGDGTQSFLISAVQDVDTEDERLTLRFGALPAGIGSGAVASAEVTIVDDESAVTRVSFIGASYPAPEGGAVAVTVGVQPQAATARTIPITTTPRGTTASGDYSITGRALTIGAGQSTGVLTIKANEDADAVDEVVELGFGALPAGTSAGVQATTEVVLTDNDAASLEAAYGAAGYVAAEGSTAVAVTVNLSQTAQSEVSLPITVTPRGTATASDYVIGGLSQGRTLRFAAGTRSQTLTVSAAEDADAANEAVVLGFGSGTVPAGKPAVAVVTLQDNDTTALNVQFSASSYAAIEGGAAATVAVSLNQPALAELAIPITSSPRGTTRESDYRVDGLTADAIVFAVGEQRQSFTVTANVDADATDEAVELGFGGVVPAGAISVAVVSLQEPVTRKNSRLAVASASQSRALPAVGFVGTEHEVTEGAAVSVTVRLTAVLAESVAVPITATPRGTTLPEDYALAGLHDGALVFEAGDRQKAFTVRANEDADAQHETLELAFGTLPDSVTADSQATATVRIADDERAVVERITRVNAALMPHLARATTASAIDAISGRIASARTGTGQRPEFDTTGLKRLHDALAARERGGSAAGQSELPGAEQVLGDTSFAMPLAAVVDTGEAGEPTGGAVPALWGTGDYRNLGSAASEGAVEWSGNLFGAHVGLDTPVGSRLLAGVALSWARGAFEYRDRQESPETGGTHRSWTLSAYPYLSWAPSDALGLWAALGYGGGQIEVDDHAADVQISDVRRIGAAGGVRATLVDDRLIPGGTTSVTAVGEGAYTWTDVTGRALIESLMVHLWRGRVALEGAHERALPWSSRIRPAVEVGVRYDGGKAKGGAGVEIGGGLRYREPWGLTIEGRGRILVAHQSGYREWAAGGRLSLEPGRDRQGLSVSVAPSYGQGAISVGRLWDSGMADPASSPNAAAAIQGGRVNAGLSYGVLVADRALITPYGGITVIQDGMRRYRVGGKLDLGSEFVLDLVGEHEVAPSGTTSQQLSIEGTVRL